MKSHANTDFLRVVNGTRHKRVSRKWFISLVFFILRCKITTNGFPRHLWLLIFINIEINIRGKSYYKLHENAENLIFKTLLNTPKLLYLNYIAEQILNQMYLGNTSNHKGPTPKLQHPVHDVNIPNPVGKTKKCLPKSRSINTGKFRWREESMRYYKPRKR